MTLDDFQMPSEMPGGGGSHPSMAQLSGRLVWILPTGREDNVTTDLQPTPHTRLTVELAFLDGAPISTVLDKQGQIKSTFTPPVQPGQVMTGRFMNQSWFVSRLKDKVGQVGFPGIVGVLKQIPGKRNPLWALGDPTPEQMAQARQWFSWKQSQAPGAANYVPAPPAPPVPTAFVQQQPPAQYAQPAAPQAPQSPFAQPPAQYAPQPGYAPAAAGPMATPAGYPAPGVPPQQPTAPVQPPAAPPMGQWAPQVPAGAQVVSQPEQPPAPAPAAQPGPGVPPWQR